MTYVRAYTSELGQLPQRIQLERTLRSVSQHRGEGSLERNDSKRSALRKTVDSEQRDRVVRGAHLPVHELMGLLDHGLWGVPIP